MPLSEGWYLMDNRALERELQLFRTGEGPGGEHVEALSIDAALAFRNAGNLPDDLDRTLRLVLVIETEDDLRNLDAKRAALEPDYLDAPTWRREGSRPVNVVPLRAASVRGTEQAWHEDPEMDALESQWRESGTVEGVTIPGDYRSFLFKSIVALRSTGREITVESLCGALERWLDPAQVAEIRAALEDAN